MSLVRAYAVTNPKGALEPFEYELAPLTAQEVEIAIESCGLCHSDLSMTRNEWGNTTYPLVPGHEIVGTVVALGDQVPRLRVGQRVGVGWFSRSCMSCMRCLRGDHNMCVDAEQTIVGRHGGFADKVRCHWSWATPVPEGIDPLAAGPLFCGGVTVFNPIVQCGVLPTDRVGVVGIGGLGHMALQLLSKWGCHVTAFTSSANKAQEAKRFGAHRIVNSRSGDEIKAVAGSLDFLLVTVNVPLEWSLYLQALAPRGRFHVVGGVLEPIPVPAFGLIGGQKSVSGSPLGSPATTRTMLEFCARHAVAPQIERFPLSKVNDAIAHLEAGKARYRIVLENDFSS